LHPASSQLLSEQTDKMASEEGSGYEALLGESGGTGWEWVVVCQVRGRGRGVINRAEKEIRKWVSPTFQALTTLTCSHPSLVRSNGCTC
jgi:hypothetical protein